MSRFVALAVACLLAVAATADAGPDDKLDAALRVRAQSPRGVSRVILQTVEGASPDAILMRVRARAGRRLPLLGGQVAAVPDTMLDALARDPDVRAISLDRRIRGTMERTAPTVGAPWVWESLGFDGAGIGVAIVDSGVTAWHDDLSQRVVHFADFVNHQRAPSDEYGHGTHVAGIISGSGYDSGGARRGIAPGASIVALKVLDGAGDGYISNVIAALDYAIERRQDFNLRVVNLSVAAGVYQSYTTDPLTLACKRAVDAGLVVVTSAGNFGRDGDGLVQDGGITAPGNAPWVLTVGATTHEGTPKRDDDSLAPFSSHGPSAIDGSAKPDIVAPGVGIESIADSGSLLFTSRPDFRLWGTVRTAAEPYMRMSGTSMASPVVTGTIALMLQANPSLTPNLVKAILQYTAEDHETYGHLAEGAGFLNARGAVQLAQSLGNKLTTSPKDPTPWSRQIIWGNRRVAGGVIKVAANAWDQRIVWGADTAADGERIVLGTQCAERECDELLWSASEVDPGEWSLPPDAALPLPEDAADAPPGDGGNEQPAPGVVRALAALAPVRPRVTPADDEASPA